MAPPRQLVVHWGPCDGGTPNLFAHLFPTSCGFFRPAAASEVTHDFARGRFKIASPLAKVMRNDAPHDALWVAVPAVKGHRGDGVMLTRAVHAVSSHVYGLLARALNPTLVGAMDEFVGTFDGDDPRPLVSLHVRHGNGEVLGGREIADLGAFVRRLVDGLRALAADAGRLGLSVVAGDPPPEGRSALFPMRVYLATDSGAVEAAVREAVGDASAVLTYAHVRQRAGRGTSWHAATDGTKAEPRSGCVEQAEDALVEMLALGYTDLLLRATSSSFTIPTRVVALDRGAVVCDVGSDALAKNLTRGATWLHCETLAEGRVANYNL